MRLVGAAGRADDDIARAHRVLLGAKAQGALAAQDHKELVIDMVDVVRKRLLPRRHHSQPAAELGGTERCCDRCDTRLEPGLGLLRALRHQLDLIDVDEGTLCHSHVPFVVNRDSPDLQADEPGLWASVL